MDAKTDESSPTMSPDPQRNVIPPQTQERGYLSGETRSPNLLDPSSLGEGQAARALAYAFEMREAKVRELHGAVKSGAYHVTAEQIADKMLRDTLCELLP